MTATIYIMDGISPEEARAINDSIRDMPMDVFCDDIFGKGNWTHDSGQNLWIAKNPQHRGEGYLFDMESGMDDLFGKAKKTAIQACKREAIIGAPQTDWMEWQAGYACGAFLMPVTGLRKLAGEYQERHGIFGPVSMTSMHAAALIDAVREHFQVSEDAARVRLLKLDMLTQGAMNQSLMA